MYIITTTTTAKVFLNEKKALCELWNSNLEKKWEKVIVKEWDVDVENDEEF